MIPSNQPVLTEGERTLFNLAQDCNRLTSDIKNELQNLRPKQRKSKVQSSLVALKQ